MGIKEMIVFFLGLLLKAKQGLENTTRKQTCIS
jgi:hypothetical protein